MMEGVRATFRPFKTYSNLTVAAGQVVQLDVTGSYLACFSSSAASFKVAFDDGRQSEFFEGAEFVGLDGTEFHKVQIINPNGSAMTVDIAISDGQFRDRRLKISGSGLSLTKPATLVSTADMPLVAATKTLVKAADTTRRSIVIGNLTGADLRYGDTDIGAGRGDIIPAGGKAVIATTDAIYAYSTPGGDITILETKD